MNPFQVVILSLIEGLTEFIPVSSTGHLILAQEILSVPSSEFSKSFDIVIQLAAIMAVVFTYYRQLTSQRLILLKSFLAFIPTGIIGLVLYPHIKNVLLDNYLITSLALLVGGLILIFIDKTTFKHTNPDIRSLSLKSLLGIGLFQSLAIVPGVSRSAATIIGGQVFGLSRIQSVEFSFFLAIPTMLAATSFDLLKSGAAFNRDEYLLLGLGCLISFLSALTTIKLLTNYTKRHSFKIFGYYRILLAVGFLILIKQ